MDAFLTFLAQDLGTRPNPVQPTAPSATGGLGDLVQLGIALVVIVAALKWLAPMVLAKLQGRIRTPLSSSLRVEESATFGAGQLSVVTVRGRTLLLGCTSQSVAFLADLTEADLAERAQPEPFVDMLDRSEGAPPIPEGQEDLETGGMAMEEALSVITQARQRFSAQGAASHRIERLIDGQL
jgi:flagellar biogenesis protein FliO